MDQKKEKKREEKRIKLDILYDRFPLINPYLLLDMPLVP